MKETGVMEGGLYRALDAATKFLLLNLLWLVCCLPVVTAFPSTTAMFGVVREWRKGREPGLAGSFFSLFKENFRQSFGLGVLWGAFGAALALDFDLIGGLAASPARSMLFGALLLLGALYALTSIFLFPVLVNYSSGWASSIKNSLLISIFSLPRTLLCLLVLGLAAALVFYAPVCIFVNGSLAAYLIYSLCESPFERVEAARRDGR